MAFVGLRCAGLENWGNSRSIPTWPAWQGVGRQSGRCLSAIDERGLIAVSGLSRRLYIGGLVAASVCVAAISWRDAALQYWRRQAAQDIASGGNVPSMFAHDPQIRLALALARFQNLAVDRNEAAVFAADARATLRSDPINPDALYVLGMVAEQGRLGAGIPFFALAERLSRRHVYNELALESVLSAQGDLAGAVARIDNLVSVAPDMAAPIFSSIAPALQDASLRAAFVPYSRRPWYGYLVKSAVENGVDTTTILTLLHSGGRFINPAMKADIYAGLIRRSMSDKDFVSVRRLVDELPSKDRQTIASFGFLPGSNDPRLSVLGWTLANDATTSAAIGGDGKLSVSVEGEQSRVVATRTTLLAAGRYVLTQTVGHDLSSSRAGLIWNLSCTLSPDVPIWRQPIPDRGVESASYQSIITIPVNCAAQDWGLISVGEAGQGASTVTIGGLQLRRQ